MTRLKFTVGNAVRGYKSVEISIVDAQIEYKILRNELNHVDKEKIFRVPAEKFWLDGLNSLKIFEWEPNYFKKSSDGVQWSLTFGDDEKIYRGRGVNSFPDDFETLLDLLDALIPEMNFVDGNRIDGIELNLSRQSDSFVEKLSLTRAASTLTIEKSTSTHSYRLKADDTKTFLDICRKFFDGIELTHVDAAKTLLVGKLSRHNGTEINFSAEFGEDFMTGIVDFAEKIHAFAPDLTAEIFSPEKVRRLEPEKIILCKVQFKGNYKSYTYRADDDFFVGDVVDVPVGRNNDVAQAKIVEVSCFDIDNTPFPVEKIKTIIGKHVFGEWEDF